LDKFIKRFLLFSQNHAECTYEGSELQRRYVISHLFVVHALWLNGKS